MCFSALPSKVSIYRALHEIICYAGGKDDGKGRGEEDKFMGKSFFPCRQRKVGGI